MRIYISRNLSPPSENMIAYWMTPLRETPLNHFPLIAAKLKVKMPTAWMEVLHGDVDDCAPETPLPSGGCWKTYWLNQLSKKSTKTEKNAISKIHDNILRQLKDKCTNQYDYEKWSPNVIQFEAASFITACC